MKEMAAKGKRLFSAINFNDYVTKSKFDFVKRGRKYAHATARPLGSMPVASVATSPQVPLHGGDR